MPPLRLSNVILGTRRNHLTQTPLPLQPFVFLLMSPVSSNNTISNIHIEDRIITSHHLTHSADQVINECRYG